MLDWSMISAMWHMWESHISAPTSHLPSGNLEWLVPKSPYSYLAITSCTHRSWSVVSCADCLLNDTPHQKNKWLTSSSYFVWPCSKSFLDFLGTPFYETDTGFWGFKMVQTHSNKIFGAHPANIFLDILPKINQNHQKRTSDPKNTLNIFRPTLHIPIPGSSLSTQRPVLPKHVPPSASSAPNAASAGSSSTGHFDLEDQRLVYHISSRGYNIIRCYRDMIYTYKLCVV